MMPSWLYQFLAYAFLILFAAMWFWPGIQCRRRLPSETGKVPLWQNIASGRIGLSFARGNSIRVALYPDTVVVRGLFTSLAIPLARVTRAACRPPDLGIGVHPLCITYREDSGSFQLIELNCSNGGEFLHLLSQLK